MLRLMRPDPIHPRESAVTLAVADFLDACRSPNTEAAYRADLDHLASWCADQGPLDLLTINVEDIARYRTACELAGAAPATVARRLSTISSFGAFAAANGARPALDTEIPRPRVGPTSSTDLLSDADAQRLLEAADHADNRAAVLIRLLMLDGLKAGEVIRADAADAQGRPPDMTLRVHEPRPRSITLHADSGSAIHRYLARRRTGALLLSNRRGHEPTRLTRFGVDYLIKRVSRSCGIGRPVSASMLRRRYVMAEHADGTALDTIRDHIGHVDRSTTRRYLRIDRPH